MVYWGDVGVVGEVKEDSGGNGVFVREWGMVGSVLMRERLTEQLKQRYFEGVRDCLGGVLQFLQQPSPKSLPPQQIISDECRYAANFLLKLCVRLMLGILIADFELLHIFENLQAVSDQLFLVLSPIAARRVEFSREDLRL